MSYRLFLDDIRMPYEVGNYISPVELRKEYKNLIVMWEKDGFKG